MRKVESFRDQIETKRGEGDIGMWVEWLCYDCGTPLIARGPLHMRDVPVTCSCGAEYRVSEDGMPAQVRQGAVEQIPPAEERKEIVERSRRGRRRRTAE
jgi:hypothetical protein